MKNKIGKYVALMILGLFMTLVGFSYFIREGSLSENNLLYIIPGLILLGYAIYKVIDVKK